MSRSHRGTVGVIGAGVSGLTAAHVLAATHDVTVFEADQRLGGHAHTHDVAAADGRTLRIDSGFIVHNERTYPNLLRLFRELDVATRETEMSMSVAYGATKPAQINLLEAMRASLSRDGIRVTTVSPGFVRTAMTAGNAFRMPFMIEPEQAATAIADGIESTRPEIVFPLPMAVLMKTVNVLPVRLWAGLAARLGPAS